MIVALFSLGISFFTFYYAHLRPPDIRAIFEPQIEVYRNFAKEGGLGFLAIVTFANKSSQTGIIARASLLVQREGSLVKGYDLKWNEFDRLDAKRKEYVYDEHAHALTVSGNSTVTKQIWFHCFEPNFALDQARYAATLRYWGEKKSDLQQVERRFTVDSELYDKLEQDRKNRKSTCHSVQLEEE